MNMSLMWLVRGSENPQVFDEFLVDHFRLRLHGTLLTLEAVLQGDSSEISSAASVLAHRYCSILNSHVPFSVSLITMEQYAAIQPPFSQNHEYSTSRTEQERFREGVRLARHDMLALSDPYLRRSYDYLERAREDEANSVFHLYKFVETLEGAFDGAEAKLIRALDMKTAVKILKQLANDKSHDGRHAPNVSGAAKCLSFDDQNLMDKCAHEILRAYECWTLRVGSRSQTGQV